MLSRALLLLPLVLLPVLLLRCWYGAWGAALWPTRSQPSHRWHTAPLTDISNFMTLPSVPSFLQEVLRGSNVLACAASNVAVDNLVERLAKVGPLQPKGGGGSGGGLGAKGVNVVRVGHPARLLPQVKRACTLSILSQWPNRSVQARAIRSVAGVRLCSGRSASLFGRLAASVHMHGQGWMPCCRGLASSFCLSSTCSCYKTNSSQVWVL